MEQKTDTTTPQRPAGGGPAAAAEELPAPEPQAGELPAPDQQATAELLAKAEAELVRLKDEYLRALAEVENTRRRAQRDREEASQYAISAFARDLLSVADNLRRALDAVDDAARKTEPALDTLIGGVELTEKDLVRVFERYGVRPIEADGQPFDPHVHEAMFEMPDASVPAGTVVQVLERGYRLHERTLRPSRVAVSRGGPKPGAQAAQAAAPSSAADAYDAAGGNDEPRPGARLDERS
jgi:molecular chaperone GrpE